MWTMFHLKKVVPLWSLCFTDSICHLSQNLCANSKQANKVSLCGIYKSFGWETKKETLQFKWRGTMMAIHTKSVVKHYNILRTKRLDRTTRVTAADKSNWDEKHLVKKIDFFSAEKWRKLALFSAAECGPAAMQDWMAVIDAFSAEKNGATQRSSEKNCETRREVAFFSATAVLRTFFH